MKTKITVFFMYFLVQAACLSAQNSIHPTIRSFSLRFEDGNTSAVSDVVDSSVVVVYEVALNEVSDIKKIHVRISSGRKTDGNLLSTGFDINAGPVMDAAGKTVFIREKDVVTIRTIGTRQRAANNYEVYTENNKGVMSPALNWKK